MRNSGCPVGANPIKELLVKTQVVAAKTSAAVKPCTRKNFLVQISQGPGPSMADHCLTVPYMLRGKADQTSDNFT